MATMFLSKKSLHALQSASPIFLNPLVKFSKIVIFLNLFSKQSTTSFYNNKKFSIWFHIILVRLKLFVFYRLIAFLVTTFYKQLFRTFRLMVYLFIFLTEGKVNMTLILPILHSYYNSSVDPLKLSSSSIYLHCFTVIKLS